MRAEMHARSVASAASPTPSVGESFLQKTDWGVDLDGVRVPVAVWHGEQDVAVPAAHGGWLAGVIPGAELRVLPDDGHVSLIFGREGRSWAGSPSSWTGTLTRRRSVIAQRRLGHIWGMDEGTARDNSGCRRTVVIRL
jgi:hypothetical protein